MSTENPHTCPVCASPLISPSRVSGVGDSYDFDCPKCGEFRLAGPLVASLPHLLTSDVLASVKLSYALRRANRDKTRVTFTTDIAEAVLAKPLPTPAEQADLLVRWLAENLPAPGETLWLEPSKHSSVIGAVTPKGFGLVLDHLFNVGILSGHQSRTANEAGRAHATLTLKGWEYFHSLRRGGAIHRKAFMAMKFGDAQLDAVLDRVFKPAARAAGFELRRLDDVPRAGLIDDRLRVEIQSADFVVADLTHDNLGAYWEAGYAEGLGKPVIYTCERSKFESAKTHFDTNHHLTIPWDANAPDSAGDLLKATIRATLPHIATLSD